MGRIVSARPSNQSSWLRRLIFVLYEKYSNLFLQVLLITYTLEDHIPVLRLED